MRRLPHRFGRLQTGDGTLIRTTGNDDEISARHGAFDRVRPEIFFRTDSRSRIRPLARIATTRIRPSPGGSSFHGPGNGISDDGRQISETDAIRSGGTRIVRFPKTQVQVQPDKFSPSENIPRTRRRPNTDLSQIFRKDSGRFPLPGRTGSDRRGQEYRNVGPDPISERKRRPHPSRDRSRVRPRPIDTDGPCRRAAATERKRPDMPLSGRSESFYKSSFNAVLLA